MPVGPRIVSLASTPLQADERADRAGECFEVRRSDANFVPQALLDSARAIRVRVNRPLSPGIIQPISEAEGGTTWRTGCGRGKHAPSRLE